jgi:hopanoid-associated phosphorylase
MSAAPAAIGVIVGMKSEAALLAEGMLMGCTGGRPEKAAAIAARMLEQGADGLISFGIGGGLAPGLRPGTLVVASAVDLGGATLAADPAWFRHLANQFPQARQGIVCGVSAAVVTPKEKAALHAETGGLLADMESGAVAEACAAAGKPFAVLRAVADPAERAIPPFALQGLDEEGGTRILPVLKGLLLHPFGLPALLALARDSQAALRALGAAARLLGPTLGF